METAEEKGGVFHLARVFPVFHPASVFPVFVLAGIAVFPVFASAGIAVCPVFASSSVFASSCKTMRGDRAADIFGTTQQMVGWVSFVHGTSKLIQQN